MNKMESFMKELNENCGKEKEKTVKEKKGNFTFQMK